MKIIVFAYNFPHKKTQDFLLRLSLSGLKPDLVIASPPQQLALPKSILKDKYRHIDLVDPKHLCQSLKFNYLESAHDSRETIEALRSIVPDLGIIAASRILKREAIEAFKLGVLNFHPGIIPENRGLNAVKWAVYKNIPQGMTAHFIDERVDAGRVLKKVIIPVYQDDTLKDINMRIHEVEVKELIPTLDLIFKGEHRQIEVQFTNDGYHPPADESIDRTVISRFEEYKKKWASKK